MRMTTLDIIDSTYLALNIAEVRSVISGGVYKVIRPLNSTSEDIVINSLPTVNFQLQRAIVNVNIHVPNLKIGTKVGQDNSQPNFARLREITSIVIGILNDKFFGQFWFDVQQQSIFAQPEINYHYSNIRVEFYNLNIKNS